MDYKKQANDFCEKHGVEITKKYLKHDFHFDDDISKRDIYEITIKRNGKTYTFNYGQSVFKSFNDDERKRLENLAQGSSFLYNYIYKQIIDSILKREDSKKNCYLFLKDFKMIKRKKFKMGSSDLDEIKTYQDLINFLTPSNYCILASLQKYDEGSFEDFCNSYGYDTDSKRAENIYNKVQKEYINVLKMFYDCLEELSEIQ